MPSAKTLLGLALTSAAYLEASAFMTSSAPMLRSGVSIASCRAPLVRTAKVAVRMQTGELSAEEKAEYEALVARAKELKQTYKEIMENAMPDEPAPVQDGPKGFAIPIEEMDDSDYVEPEPEVIDPSTLSPEDRAWYEQEQVRNAADNAYEAAEQAIRVGDLKKARKQNKIAWKKYSECGVLGVFSIFAPSFMDALEQQKERCTPAKVVSTETSYAKKRNPWDV